MVRDSYEYPTAAQERDAWAEAHRRHNVRAVSSTTLKCCSCCVLLELRKRDKRDVVPDARLVARIIRGDS